MENSRKSRKKKFFFSAFYFRFRWRFLAVPFLLYVLVGSYFPPSVHLFIHYSELVIGSFFLFFSFCNTSTHVIWNHKQPTHKNQQWAPLWSTTQSQRTTATTSVWALRGLPTSLVSVSSSSLSRTPWTCMSSATSETHTTLLLARASCQGTQTDTTRTGSTGCSSEPLTMPSSSLVTLTSIRLIVLPSQRVPGWGLLWTHVPYLPEHWVLHWTSHWSQ